MVFGEPLIAYQSETRLVFVAGPGSGWRSTEQLAKQFWRPCLDQGRQPVLLPFVSEATTRCELAESGTTCGDVERAALLAGPRSRWVSRGCDVDDDQR